MSSKATALDPPTRHRCTNRRRLDRALYFVSDAMYLADHIHRSIQTAKQQSERDNLQLGIASSSKTGHATGKGQNGFFEAKWLLYQDAGHAGKQKICTGTDGTVLCCHISLISEDHSTNGISQSKQAADKGRRN